MVFKGKHIYKMLEFPAGAPVIITRKLSLFYETENELWWEISYMDFESLRKNPCAENFLTLAQNKKKTLN